MNRGKTIVLVVVGILLLAGFSESLARGCRGGWGRMSGWDRGSRCSSVFVCSTSSEMSWRGCFGLLNLTRAEISEEHAAEIESIIEEANRAIYEILEGYGIEDIEEYGCYSWDYSR